MGIRYIDSLHVFSAYFSLTEERPGTGTERRETWGESMYAQLRRFIHPFFPGLSALRARVLHRTRESLNLTLSL